MQNPSVPMNRQTLLLLVLPALFLFCSFCSGRDDVSAIREMIQKAADLAEQQDIGGIMAFTTEDFQALPGKMDQRLTKRLLWLVFKKYGQLRVMHPVPDVEVMTEGREATARFPFLILKKDHGLPSLQKFYEDPQRWVEEIGESGDLYRLRLELVKKEGDWLVKQAVLESFTGLGFRG